MPRPYIARFTSLSRLICPSVCPLLSARVRPARTSSEPSFGRASLKSLRDRSKRQVGVDLHWQRAFAQCDSVCADQRLSVRRGGHAEGQPPSVAVSVTSTTRRRRRYAGGGRLSLGVTAPAMFHRGAPSRSEAYWGLSPPPPMQCFCKTLENQQAQVSASLRIRRKKSPPRIMRGGLWRSSAGGGLTRDRTRTVWRRSRHCGVCGARSVRSGGRVRG